VSPMKQVTVRRWVVALAVAGPLGFAGVGVYAVAAGSAETDRICDAVTGLRNDVVLSLTKVKDRAIVNAAGDPEEVARIKEAYNGPDGLITIISDPECP
jgi:hypothetical protein